LHTGVGTGCRRGVGRQRKVGGGCGVGIVCWVGCWVGRGGGCWGRWGARVVLLVAATPKAAGGWGRWCGVGIRSCIRRGCGLM